MLVGASNVAAAFAFWSRPLREKQRAFRLILYMALVSIDKDDPPRFWGGRDDLAVAALGRDVTAGDAERRAAYEAFRASVADLTKCGAIVCTATGRIGRN